MSPRSDQKKLIEWLNALIVLAQWDKSLPVYFARLFNQPDQYEKALQLIRNAPKDGQAPEAPGDALTTEEWQKLYRVTTRAQSLRKLFDGERDPFQGAQADEISLLADVSDLTTDSQTMFYSRNGTFQLVLENVRQRPDLDTTALITDGLNKFYTLLDTNGTVAEELHKLACSNDWYPVLASLYDARDYTADESLTASESLEQWNRNLTTELRSILLKPTKLYRVPKKLIKLAWERRSIFRDALKLISPVTGLNDFERRQRVSNVAYSMFVHEAKREVEEIESDLQLLAFVARHYLNVRKFVKLDGLVSGWPKIASLAMSNYRNLEYVEDFFVEKKQRPTPEELEKRDARELYERCANDPAVIRFFRLKPYFREINEDELRRYRPLAPVTVSDPSQQSSTTIISPPAVNIAVTGFPPTVVTSAHVCELVIKPTQAPPEDEDFAALLEIEYEISLRVSGDEVAKGKNTFSVRRLLDRVLSTIGVTSEDSLQSIMKGLFSGTNPEKVLVRGGLQLLETIITQTGLEDALIKAFKGDAPIRLVIVSDLEALQFLPWEWLPRPGYADLLLSDARFSLVRCREVLVEASTQPITSPTRVMGLFPNSPVGTRDISEGSRTALETLTTEGAQYKRLERDEASFVRITDEVEKFLPHIVHFEGYVDLVPKQKSTIWVLFSSLATATQPIHFTRFGNLLFMNKVQLLVVGRNESSRMIGNVGPIFSHRLAKSVVPVVLVPIRAVDDVTATSLIMEFYRAFLAGNNLEQALYIARRKVASRGGDWTAFALFANPSVLDFFQPLPPTP